MTIEIDQKIELSGERRSDGTLGYKDLEALFGPVDSTLSRYVKSAETVAHSTVQYNLPADFDPVQVVNGIKYAMMGVVETENGTETDGNTATIFYPNYQTFTPYGLNGNWGVDVASPHINFGLPKQIETEAEIKIGSPAKPENKPVNITLKTGRTLGEGEEHLLAETLEKVPELWQRAFQLNALKSALDASDDKQIYDLHSAGFLTANEIEEKLEGVYASLGDKVAVLGAIKRGELRSLDTEAVNKYLIQKRKEEEDSDKAEMLFAPKELRKQILKTAKTISVGGKAITFDAQPGHRIEFHKEFARLNEEGKSTVLLSLLLAGGAATMLTACGGMASAPDINSGSSANSQPAAAETAVVNAINTNDAINTATANQVFPGITPSPDIPGVNNLSVVPMSEGQVLDIPISQDRKLSETYELFKQDPNIQGLFSDPSSVKYSAKGLELYYDPNTTDTIPATKSPYAFFTAQSYKEGKSYIAMVFEDQVSESQYVVSYKVLTKVTDPNGLIGLGISDPATQQDVMIFSFGVTQAQYDQLSEDQRNNLSIMFMPSGQPVPREELPNGFYKAVSLEKAAAVDMGPSQAQLEGALAESGVVFSPDTTTQYVDKSGFTCTFAYSNTILEGTGIDYIKYPQQDGGAAQFMCENLLAKIMYIQRDKNPAIAQMYNGIPSDEAQQSGQAYDEMVSIASNYLQQNGTIPVELSYKSGNRINANINQIELNSIEKGDFESIKNSLNSAGIDYQTFPDWVHPKDENGNLPKKAVDKDIIMFVQNNKLIVYVYDMGNEADQKPFTVDMSSGYPLLSNLNNVTNYHEKDLKYGVLKTDYRDNVFSIKMALVNPGSYEELNQKIAEVKETAQIGLDNFGGAWNMQDYNNRINETLVRP